MQAIVVSDTNIFIDLKNADLLECFFQLPFEIHTTDFVVYELIKDHIKEEILKYQSQNKLHIKTFNEAEIKEVNNLCFSQQEKLSYTDCSVWYYAKKNNYILLTGDLCLRKTVDTDSVEVHGTLYLFDLFVEYGILKKEIAAKKLKQLFSEVYKTRLPVHEVNSRILKWENRCNP